MITIGMGNTKIFVSQYIMRLIIAIINIITISLNSTATKIVKIRLKHFTDVHLSKQ